MRRCPLRVAPPLYPEHPGPYSTPTLRRRVANDPVSFDIDDGVAVIRLDDGKVNAVGHRLIELVTGHLDEAERHARAVAIVGRAGCFSAGFDLAEMTSGIDRARALVAAGGRLLMRVYGHPQPVVAAVTGHALAAGALLALSCDTRIGAEGSAKIGLNETAIGLRLPEFATELATARLSPTHLTRAAVQAEIFDPAGAAAAGFLDRVVAADECETAAVGEARRLGELAPEAYAHTKLTLRAPLVARVLAGLEADMASFTAPRPA